ncbi:DUF2235 domain-containing protein, partial [Brenneria sp. g21c3]|uniref:T6SS phospholipase effector Tle1-like catalytic domain-containing protein n=1 Tax=Brenneria sp. g21c3 TaxID=3093893 RepID=UPI002EA00A74|nr:DUF2235 domain-containing protein [Brenneria sp. g21c3]
MSKIKPQDTAWLPPAFPLNGRLPNHPYPVAMNERRQNSLEQRYYDECCLAAGKRVWRPCCKTLHVSLFFDGTGNNLHNDVYVDEHPHPSNIARLFRAAIGSGHAGGAALENALLDVPPAGSETYFKFYMPGVGTPFPEIGELDYSNLGLATASGGENRINWGLLRLIDALMRALKLGKLEDTASLAAVGDMATSWAALGLGGAHNRYETFYRYFNRLQNNIWQAMNPTGRGKAKLMGMKLYVYGFSRGAAQARTFVNWLTELFPKPDKADGVPAQVLQGSNPACRLPVSVEFLGLLDTVASVGVANIAPFAAGHMAWADGTQALPDDARFGGLVKQCVHLVASHEQRLCFPLDSLRRGNGQYPRNSVEVIYPGMHSDIGGGYPPGDQGKGIDVDDGSLLSQIALHELYATAFAAGAPLKVPKEALPRHLALDSWRSMSIDIGKEFTLAPDLIHRFNAWREATLGLSPSAQPAGEESDNGHYQPGRAGLALEALIANQMAWLTAWRIDRYARGSALNCAFYRAATDSHANAGSRKAAEAARDERQKSAERA